MYTALRSLTPPIKPLHKTKSTCFQFDRTVISFCNSSSLGFKFGFAKRSELIIEGGGIRSLTNYREGGGSTQELESSSPVSVELEHILNEAQFDRVLADAQQLDESVVILCAGTPCQAALIDGKFEIWRYEYEKRYQYEQGNQAWQENHLDEESPGMARWCRKCIYLKPKLEKLAAGYYPRTRFYCIDVNNVPHKLVVRAGVTKMPTIQLWKDSKKQGEVIGSHKAYLVVNEVREMIENEDPNV